MQLNRNNNRTVYSTSQGRICPVCGNPIQACICKTKKNSNTIKRDGIVRLRIERKGRGGKSVTLVEGLPEDEILLKDLAKELKRVCGSGGSVKKGVIEIQGDVRDTALKILKDKGYIVKKAGG